MPTIERPIDNLHTEVYAPTGGFIFGVSVFGDSFGGDAFRFGLSKMGDTLTNTHDDWQWVDYIDTSTSITLDRGETREGASSSVSVGLFSCRVKNAANPLTDYKVRAGRNIRLRYEDEILFSGNITKIPGKIVRRKNVYTKYFTLAAADTVKKLAAIKKYGAGGLSEPYESFEARIARLLTDYDGAVELPTGDNYPTKKLSAIVYESSLASHLDLACNSVGASWYIDKLGQIRFKTELTDNITAVFSDGTHTETLDSYFAYYDIDLEYDPKNHVNYLELTNMQIIEDPANPGNELAANTGAVYADSTSVRSNGYLSSKLDISLYDEGAYSGSVATRADEILTALKKPKPTITKLYFNVQESFEVTRIETAQLVELWHEGTKYTLRTGRINMSIAPKEWLLEVDLKEE
jgi:hypothetical protein